MGTTIRPEQEQCIRGIAAAEGRPAELVLNDLIESGLAHRQSNGGSAETSPAALARLQRAALRKCLEVIDAIESDVADDGTGSERHDEIIYRRDW